MTFVTDASVAAAWVLPDEAAAIADLALERLGEETAKVPNVFWDELRNLLLSAERRGRIDARHADMCSGPHQGTFPRIEGRYRHARATYGRCAR